MNLGYCNDARYSPVLPRSLRARSLEVTSSWPRSSRTPSNDGALGCARASQSAPFRDLRCLLRTSCKTGTCISSTCRARSSTPGTWRGTLFYNGRTSEESFLSRFPFKGGVVLEADWNGKVLWNVRHPDHHHHGILLRNGNVLLHCMAEVPDDVARRVTGGMVESNMQSGQYAPRPQAEAGKM